MDGAMRKPFFWFGTSPTKIPSAAFVVQEFERGILPGGRRGDYNEGENKAF